MRNRAKCALCKEVIESFHKSDYVQCKCGQIAIDGGPFRLLTSASDYANFLRVDDEGNVMSVQYKENEHEPDSRVDKEEKFHAPTREEVLGLLDSMIKAYDNLPPHAMLAPVSHADHKSLLMLVLSLFKSTSAS